MLLDVRDLGVSYGQVHALHAVSFTTAGGEIAAMLGSNGAGKSSLLRALIGQAPVHAGTITFDGVRIDRWDTRRRIAAGLALVPEGRQILVGLTVHENLLLGAYLRRDRIAVSREIDEIYGRFPNLAERRDLRAAVLSGGEQQMLAIGRALLSKPKLLLLDEPSLGLSPLYVRRVFGWIGDLNRQGLSIILVEQNTRLALTVAHRSYVLRVGELATRGTGGALRESSELMLADLSEADQPTPAARPV